MSEQTHEELMIQTAKAMEAWYEAKKNDDPPPAIEAASMCSSPSWFTVEGDPGWGATTLYYRIAQPKVVTRVPLGPEDFPDGLSHSLRYAGWGRGIRVAIVDFDVNDVQIITRAGTVQRLTYDDLANDPDWQRWDHAAGDWVPCSKEVQE